ncbi:MAG: NrfD/PsrC family molybdoenzyme membrane anchor subunit [Gordonibacter sp.]|nr:NrfD/PsrC family molybdoenzyme membrane anchor subunit [Gordonibacter sp.]
MTETTIDAGSASTSKQKSNLVVPFVFAVLGAVGVACWVMQVTGGSALALTNRTIWGLYIVGFMLCTGIAAGCLLFASSTVLFSGLAVYKPYARLGAACAVCVGAVGAGLFIMADLGSPARFWEMIAFAHVGSPLFWDTIILLAYVVVGVLFTLQLTKSATAGRDTSSLKPLAIIAFVAGVCVAITSFVFVFQVARPSWNNPGQTLSFVLSALIAAGSVLMVVFALANRSGYLAMGNKLASNLTRVLASLLLVEFIFVLTEIAAGVFAGQGSETLPVVWLISGAGAPFFWAEIVAFAAAFVLLFQKNRTLQVVGAVGSFSAVFLVKYNLLQAELFNPLLNLTAYPGGTGVASAFYLPSPIEWGVAVGVIGIVGLLFTLSMRKLKLGV